MTAVSIVISAEDYGELLQQTLQSVEAQTEVALEAIIVTNGAVDEHTTKVLTSLSGKSDVRVVASRSRTPGSQKNTGIQASRGSHVVLIDEGDALDRRYCEIATEALTKNETVAAVTSWIQMQRPGRPAGWLIAPEIDLRSLTLRPQTVPTTVMIRRQLWETVGGFDATLPALDAYDFWLNALQKGARIEVIDQPLVRRAIGAESEFRRSIDPDPYLHSMRIILERHRALFEHDPAALLYERELTLSLLVGEHRRLVDRRDRLVAERTSLESQIGELKQFAAREGQSAIDWGELRRPDPVSREWGYDRGKPIDRYYIERFLETCAADIKGVVLEVQEADFTRRLGGARVERSEVIDVNRSNAGASIYADLRAASGIAANTFDCFILTQTLHVIDDMSAVLSECFRILKPGGGSLLVTLPCASRVCLEYGTNGDFWRMTEAGARWLFSKTFPLDHLQVRSFGNVLVNTAFSYGLACHEVQESEFEACDPYNPLIVGVRAVKPREDDGNQAITLTSAPRSTPRATRTGSGVVLLYHRIGEPPTDVHQLSVDRDLFRRHMEYLRRNYAPMSVSELVAAAREGTIPPRAVAVTFDDGYLDNLTDACPTMIELGLPATFFVTTDQLDEDREYWWDTLERILLTGGSLPAVLQLRVNGEPRRFVTADFPERLAAHHALHTELVTGSAEARDAVIDDLLRWSGFDRLPNAECRVMKSRHILRIARCPGATIGVHSVHHLALPLQPIDVQRREIADSRSLLERLLGHSVTLFAYPYGSYGDDTAAVLSDLGFDAALTCDATPVRPTTDCLRLPRLDVKAWSVPYFAEQLRQLSEIGKESQPGVT